MPSPAAEFHRVHRLLPVATWDDGVRERLMRFWRGRGFAFSATDGDYLEARRGTLWGNLTSFDPSKLVTRLSVARPNGAEILCLMEIDTRGQLITEWNLRYWDLEMDTLESYLWRDHLREDEWARFLRDSSRASVLWALSGGLLGNKVPPEWKSPGGPPPRR